MASALAELKRIEAGQAVDDDLLDVIRMITVILDGIKKEEVQVWTKMDILPA